jgi:hypothetical protein
LGGEAESVSADDPYSSSYFRFDADGKLTMSGGQFADGENAWEAVQQDGNTLIVSQLQDSIQYYDYKIEFVSDNEATISLLYNENVMASNRYKRVLEKPAAAEGSKPEEASDQKPAKDADQ